MADVETRVSLTPYDMVGGAEIVRQIVDRFYDLMDQEPAFAELRAMHAPDLTPMRKSLTGFLIAWLGGPRDWFTDNPGKCVMSAHSKIAVSPATARQWVDAMGQAIAEAPVDAEFGKRMTEALEGMAMGMIRK